MGIRLMLRADWTRTAMAALAVYAGLASGRGAIAAEAKVPAKGSVTFNKDVAPMIYERCTTCHREGEVAPFSLVSYRDVSKRARLIQTTLEERKMPPWKAEPGAEHFADERRLTDAQLATFARWVEDGTPEGSPADLPAPPKFASGWQRGEPDMVLKMSEPYTLVAQGDDAYRCFVLPFVIPPGKYLKAVEYRPGNRRIVHHAVLSMLPHKMAQAKLAEGDGKSFGSGLAPPGQLLAGQLAFWTPGMEPRPLPDGIAVDWPKQADLILQLHLHPSGKPETEQSTIGLHFTDEKPREHLNLIVMNNQNINIKAGAAEHVVNASLKLPVDVQVYGIFPHMHLLGRTVNVTAKLPDGTVKPLIAIDDWDFQWQMYYEYAKPVALPAGTRLEGRFTYDNSASNPANPSKPPKPISYGEQTHDEMAIVILDVISNGQLQGRGGKRAGMSSKPASK